jgi:hypothetical protein
MSFEDVNTVLQAVITSRRGVSAAAMKIVLAVIAQHTSAKRGDHRAFPGLKRLSKMSGLSVAQVSAAVDALVEFGAFKEYKQGGGRKKSHYVINIAKLSNLGIDWLKGQGSDTEPTVQIPNPAFGYRTQGSDNDPQGSDTEPNKVLNLGFDPSLYQGSVTATSSLRESVPPSAVSSNLDEKKDQNPKPKTSGVSGAQAKTTPKANPGQRLAQPYRPEFTEPYRACKKCGDTLKRDVNHICKGKAEPLNLGTVDDITGDGGYITTKDGYRVRGL